MFNNYCSVWFLFRLKVKPCFTMGKLKVNRLLWKRYFRAAGALKDIQSILWCVIDNITLFTADAYQLVYLKISTIFKEAYTARLWNLHKDTGVRLSGTKAMNYNVLGCLCWTVPGQEQFQNTFWGTSCTFLGAFLASPWQTERHLQ